MLPLPNYGMVFIRKFVNENFVEKNGIFISFLFLKIGHNPCFVQNLNIFFKE
jgi:hypothetical protein